MMIREKCYEQSKVNLRKLGYEEQKITEIISHLKKDVNSIPYDNHGKIKYMTSDDFMYGNDKALKEFLGEYRKIYGESDILVYMLLPSFDANFQCLHTLLCTIAHEVDVGECSEVERCDEQNPDQFYVKALVFNSTCWENSEYGDVFIERTKKGLIRVG